MMDLLFWIPKIRKMILALSGVIAFFLYWVASATVPEGGEIARLIQFYGFAGLIFLYLSLLPSPLYAAFPQFPGRPLFIKARQALGVSAFFFGALHGLIVTYKVMGGISQIILLPFNYLIPILASSTALVILSILAATSPHIISRRLGTWWKPLHRFVYLAGVLLLVHSFSIGTHFTDYLQPIPLVFIAALIFLFTLQALRFANYLALKQWSSPLIARLLSFTLFFLLLLGVLTFRNLLT